MIGFAGGGASSGVTLQVTPEFASSLHDTSAFADCYLTPEEVATSPAAMAFALVFRTETAAALGVPVDQIVLNGISTDGDDVPGCAGTTPSTQSGISVTVTPEFATSLHDASAFDDCFLTPEEIAPSPAATAFADAF